MIEDKKYALLDTDFLYKSYLAQDDAQNTLADIVISFQEYEFFCHSIGFGNLSNLDDRLSNYGIPNFHLRYLYSIKYKFSGDDFRCSHRRHLAPVDGSGGREPVDAPV